MQKISKTEQKTSSLPLHFSDIRLDGELAFQVNSLPFRQSDQEITFLHHHEATEFGLCLDGSGIFMIGKRILSFQVGDVIFIPPGVPHLAQSAGGITSRWHWLYIDSARYLARTPELADLGQFTGADFTNRFSPTEAPRCNELIVAIIRTALDREPQFCQTGLTSLLTLFSIELHRQFKPAAADSYDQLLRIRKALSLLSEKSARKISIRELAGACNLSISQFRRIFRQATGQTPQEYLNALRTAMAASLLRTTSLSVTEIANRCGYPTLSCFNRLFRLIYQMTPREFRQQF